MINLIRNFASKASIILSAPKILRSLSNLEDRPDLERDCKFQWKWGQKDGVAIIRFPPLKITLAMVLQFMQYPER